MDIIFHLINKISLHQVNILLLLGLALFGGTIGGRIFKRIKIPQVVGYIMIGIAIGESGLQLITAKTLQNLQPFNYFALGLISFSLGGELKLSIFKKYGKQFTYILFFEALGAFFLVSLSFLIIGSLFLPLKTSLALAILLGSTSAATAAAGTTDVLWEYKTKGILTTTLLGIVALDDVLALFLFAICSSIASAVYGVGENNLLLNIIEPIYEIGIASLVGFTGGYFLGKLIKEHLEEQTFVFSLGIIILILGLSLSLKVDMLMAATIMGATLINLAPKKSETVFNLISKFAPPVYVLFFVFVGAKIKVKSLSLIILGLIGLFILARFLGKSLGSILGSKFSKAPAKLKKYLWLCLFSQSGVAIGLSIVAYQRFPGYIGETILLIITTSTFIVQIIGPPLIKIAITKAEETGLNITEEDILKKTYVSEVIDKNIPLISQNMNLSKILKIFTDYDYLYFPVVDKNKKLLGVIGFENIKNAFTLPNIGDLVIAEDIMSPINIHINKKSTLNEAIELMKKSNLDFLPIENEKGEIVGIIENRIIHQYVSKKLLLLQKKAEV